MSRQGAEVRVTANFIDNLRSMERFLTPQDAHRAWVALVELLRDTVIGHLKRFPNIGRSFLERRGGSVEVLDRVDRLRRRFPTGELREYVADDYLILYLVQTANRAGRDEAQSVVHLLAIRHARQLSFDLPRFWPLDLNG